MNVHDISQLKQNYKNEKMTEEQVIQMKEKIWDLFRITGNIKYYMMYKEMENLDTDGKSEDKRDRN